MMNIHSFGFGSNTQLLWQQIRNNQKAERTNGTEEASAQSAELTEEEWRMVDHMTQMMEELAEDAPELSSTRAFSYVGEMLTSIYFLAHRDSLRIRHAEREIYV